jgi:tRNA pseudouridine38-40 synthase
MRAARRDPAVGVMPPHGLSLEEVVYPDDAGLAARAAEARAVRSLPGEMGDAADRPGEPAQAPSGSAGPTTSSP